MTHFSYEKNSHDDNAFLSGFPGVMNPQSDPIAAFQNDILLWEQAIDSYQEADPLDLWFRYICWLESNVNVNKALEAKFRKAVEQCLSTYDKFENYKQDLRMVKLWIKYVSFLR